MFERLPYYYTVDMRNVFGILTIFTFAISSGKPTQHRTRIQDTQ